MDTGPIHLVYQTLSLVNLHQPLRLFHGHPLFNRIYSNLDLSILSNAFKKSTKSSSDNEMILLCLLCKVNVINLICYAECTGCLTAAIISNKFSQHLTPALYLGLLTMMSAWNTQASNTWISPFSCHRIN